MVLCIIDLFKLMQIMVHCMAGFSLINTGYLKLWLCIAGFSLRDVLLQMMALCVAEFSFRLLQITPLHCWHVIDRYRSLQIMAVCIAGFLLVAIDS